MSRSGYRQRYLLLFHIPARQRLIEPPSLKGFYESDFNFAQTDDDVSILHPGRVLQGQSLSPAIDTPDAPTCHCHQEASDFAPPHAVLRGR